MPRPRSDIDRRIVRAARARFLAEGVDGASLRAIARSARTSIGMVSYYFPSKDDLFLAVVEEVYGKLLADLERILGAESAFADRIRGVSSRIGAMTDDELEVVRLVVREALASSTRFDRVLSRFQRGHIPLMLAALGEGIENREIDAALPLPVLLGCVFGIAGAPQLILRIAGKALPFVLPTPDETAQIVARVLLHGVVPSKTSGATRATAKKKSSKRTRR